MLPLLLAHNLLQLLLPHFPRLTSTSTSRHSCLDSVPTDFPGKSRNEEKGSQKLGFPLRPARTAPHKKKPQKLGPIDMDSAGGLEVTSSHSKVKKEGTPRPSGYPFLPIAHLLSGITTQHPQEPPRDSFSTVENLNPGSPVECTNQSAENWQSERPYWL